MALQSSPYGGTTSLPQYLQKRQSQPQKPQQGQPQTAPVGPTPPPATMRPMAAQANAQAPGGNPVDTARSKPAGGMWNNVPVPPGSPGMVGSQPIPPAPPPPPAPAPAPGMAPGGQTTTRTGAQQGAPPQAPAPSFGLSELIQRMLGGESRYDNDMIERLRTQSQQSLEDERRTATDRLTTNAASRGMLRSSGLSTSLGDVEERFMRGRESAETDLMSRVADARQQDLLSAIQAAFGFGQGQLQNEAQQQNFMLALAQLGLLGGPTIPGAAAGFDSLPAPGLPEAGGGWYEWLMQNMGNKGATA